ncbi:S8 family serine peptidase [Jatrophihabitans sp. YIM 134969]
MTPVRILRAAAALGLAATVIGTPVHALAAAGCSKPTGVYTGTTAWSQALLQPARVWPVASGAGQTVAVISSGIDRSNPQFAPNQIRAGADVLPTGQSDPFTDCDGRGTFAAGIVAARPDDGTTFAGVAPDASLLAIRDIQATGDAAEGAGPLPDLLAAAITTAIDQKATVVLIGVPTPQDSPALRAAVTAARSAGIVVVSPATQTQAGAVSYPTAYPGVIGVGAIDRAGAPAADESGDYISLAAPGSQLVSTAAGAAGKLGHAYPVDDPSFAAAYVAGAVAVLRSARPELTPDQVAAQLTFTADHPPNGRDPRLGWGTVDLVAAVTAELPATIASPGATGASTAPTRTAIAALAAPPATPAPDRTAGVLALSGVAGAVVVCIVAVTIRHGRRRRWKPGHAGAVGS